MWLRDLKPGMRVLGRHQDDRRPDSGIPAAYTVQILGLSRVRVADAHGREGWIEPTAIDRQIAEDRYDEIMTQLHGAGWRDPFPVKEPAARLPSKPCGS